MKQRIPNAGQAEERTAARTARARKWARVMTLVLFGLFLTATWQDRGLAPPVHDGMIVVSNMAMGYIEGSEALSGMLAELQKSYVELTRDS